MRTAEILYDYFVMRVAYCNEIKSLSMYDYECQGGFMSIDDANQYICNTYNNTGDRNKIFFISYNRFRPIKSMIKGDNKCQLKMTADDVGVYPNFSMKTYYDKSKVNK